MLAELINAYEYEFDITAPMLIDILKACHIHTENISIADDGKSFAISGSEDIDYYWSVEDTNNNEVLVYVSDVKGVESEELTNIALIGWSLEDKQTLVDFLVTKLARLL